MERIAIYFLSLLLTVCRICNGQTMAPGTVIVSCGEYDIIDPGGDITLSSPNYPSNYPNDQHCLWVVSCTKTGAPIIITLNSFAVQSSPDCKKDSLLMRDGLRTNSTVIAHLCGTNVRKKFVSKQNNIRMEFNTNNETVAKGFELVAYCVRNETTPSTAPPPTTSPGQFSAGTVIISCGEYDIIDPGGSIEISSSNYPNNYNNNERCRYAIVCTNTNYTLKFELLDVDIQESPKCDKDVLFMKDGLRANSSLMAHLCGKSPPKREWLTTQGQMRVEFDTDATVVAKGWKAKISCLVPATTSTTSTTSTSTTSTSTTSTTSTSTASTTSTTPRPTTTGPWRAMQVCSASNILPTFVSMLGIGIACLIHWKIYSF